VAFEVLTLVTNRAKQRFQEGTRNGYALQVTHFTVGNAGHSPSSYITALTPDPGFDPTPDVTGNRIPEDAVISPLEITSAEDDTNFVTVWNCDLEKGVATGIVTSFYLLAQTVYPSSPPHPEYGLLFVYSYAYTPFSVKTDNERWPLRLGIQY
jgi:hypothetical protein